MAALQKVREHLIDLRKRHSAAKGTDGFYRGALARRNAALRDAARATRGAQGEAVGAVEM